MTEILIVEDDAPIAALLEKILHGQGYATIRCSDSAEALARLQQKAPDIILTDLLMEPINGLELLRYARIHCPDTPAIMMTAHATLSTAVGALKEGAFDYLTKPLRIDVLLETVRRALAYASKRLRIADGPLPRPRHIVQDRLAADSEAMQKLCRQLEPLSVARAPLLIRGEAGAGKRLVARIIHEMGHPNGEPCHFVEMLNRPSSFTDFGLFGASFDAAHSLSELRSALLHTAKGGTICICDVQQLPDAGQRILLQALGEKTVTDGAGRQQRINPRIIALVTDNAQSETAVPIQEELCSRLSAMTLLVPPLRERREDILPMAGRFMDRHATPGSAEPHLTADLQRALERYAWPGNVWELEDTVKFLLRHAREYELLGLDDLPPALASTYAADQAGWTQAQTRLDTYRAQRLKEFIEQEKTSLVKQMQHRKKKAP